MKVTNLISGILLLLLLCPNVSFAAGISEKLGNIRYLTAVAMENRKLDGKGVFSLLYTPVDGSTAQFPRLTNIMSFAGNNSFNLPQLQNNAKLQEAKEQFQKWATFLQTTLDAVDESNLLRTKMADVKTQWGELKVGIEQRREERGHGTTTLSNLFGRNTVE